jgi:hypothetical protein
VILAYFWYNLISRQNQIAQKNKNLPLAVGLSACCFADSAAYSFKQLKPRRSYQRFPLLPVYFRHKLQPKRAFRILAETQIRHQGNDPKAFFSIHKAGDLVLYIGQRLTASSIFKAFLSHKFAFACFCSPLPRILFFGKRSKNSILE